MFSSSAPDRAGFSLGAARQDIPHSASLNADPNTLVVVIRISCGDSEFVGFQQLTRDFSLSATPPSLIHDRPHANLMKCGCADCVCEVEGVDVHAQEPPLPSGFFLIVKRKAVRDHLQLDLRWMAPNRSALIEEGGIDRLLRSRWNESPSPGIEHMPLFLYSVGLVTVLLPLADHGNNLQDTKRWKRSQMRFCCTKSMLNQHFYFPTRRRAIHNNIRPKTQQRLPWTFHSHMIWVHAKAY